MGPQLMIPLSLELSIVLCFQGPDLYHVKFLVSKTILEYLLLFPPLTSMVFVLNMVSIATTVTKKKVRNKTDYLANTSMSLFIIKGNQGRNSDRAGT